VGEHDGRFTEEHRSRLVRWLLQELAETTDGMAKIVGAAGWTDDDWTEIAAAWSKLRWTIESWLDDAERFGRGPRDAPTP
jgi:hypothetical protein